MKTSKLILVCCFCISQLSFGQAELKTMFYNLLDFSSAPPTNRLDILNSILSKYQPDLFMVCEVESQQDGADILNQSFLYTSANIVQAPFLFNTSGASLIHQLVYYDSEKLTLKYTNQIETNVRSINHYSFELNTSLKPQLEVFVAHFKASRGTENENERFFEAQQFINYIENFSADTNILLAGDFNIYTAEEPAYQTLLNGTLNINMKDPIDAYGSWNNNQNFAGIHTQSTRMNSTNFDDFGAGGGLDDRFDFILLSEVMTSQANSIFYIVDSYKAFGNNANCFNNNINSIDCSGEYSLQLREWLYNMSDHLPVVLNLSVNSDFLSSQNFDIENHVSFLNGNLVKSRLELKFSPSLKSEIVKIYNTLGQEISSFYVSSLETSLDVSSYSNGLYYLIIGDLSNVEKFYISN